MKNYGLGDAKFATAYDPQRGEFASQYRRVCLQQKLTVGAEYRAENFNFSITPSVVGTGPIWSRR
jgi:hypothetical protein